MKISIAMATYNGAKYLDEQLNSFLFQTRKIDELVVCDDCSTDSTLVILENFKHRAPFEVNIHRNKINLGFTKNFNQSLSKCTGDLIFLSDQDDFWFKNKVEFIEKAFLDNPNKILAVHDGLLVDETLNWHGATNFGQAISGYGTHDIIVTGALTAVRRELLKFALPIPPEIIGHDGWLHNIAQLLDSRLIVNHKLQSTRRYSTNTSNWIASSFKSIDKFDVWVNQLLNRPAINYQDRLIINKSSSEYLKKILKDDNIIYQHAIEHSLRNLKEENNAISSRDILAKSNFIMRKFRALQLLKNNQYRFFNGYRSFLRDMVR